MERLSTTVELTEQIASVLRIAGFSVCVTSRLDDGFPQLIIARDWFTRLAFVRANPEALTEEEYEFRRTWTGPKILTLSTPDQALEQTGFSYGARRVRDRMAS